MYKLSQLKPRGYIHVRPQSSWEKTPPVLRNIWAFKGRTGAQSHHLVLTLSSQEAIVAWLGSLTQEPELAWAQCQRHCVCIPDPHTLLSPGYPTLWRRLVGHICTSKSHQATLLCLPQLSKLFPWQVLPWQDSGLSPSALVSQGLVKIWDARSVFAHPLCSSHFCCLWAQTCKFESFQPIQSLPSQNVRRVALLNADEISGSAKFSPLHATYILAFH